MARAANASRRARDQRLQAGGPVAAARAVRLGKIRAATKVAIVPANDDV